jgi:hypothetical protein
MTAGLIDSITTPAQGNRIPAGVPFIADNGCFGAGYPGDDSWWRWVGGLPAAGCRFVVAPDVVADAAATLERSGPWLGRIRSAGRRVALVAQDGLTPAGTPWAAIDALFVGGSTEWKLGPPARELITEARRRGVWVHIGRVNTARRYAYALAVGADSVDGTFLAFGPTTNLPRLAGWLRQAEQLALFGVSG